MICTLRGDKENCVGERRVGIIIRGMKLSFPASFQQKCAINNCQQEAVVIKQAHEHHQKVPRR